MQTRKEKTKMNKKMTSSLSLLMCGVLLSTSVLPTVTVFAETTTPATDSSTPVPTEGTLDTDLTDTSKAPDSQAPSIPSTEDNTEDTTQPSEEVQTEESDISTTQPSEEDKKTPSEQPENNQDTQPTPQGEALIPQGRGIITDTWGTSPVSFDESNGTLTVSAGTIAPNTNGQTSIGTIPKNVIKKIFFQEGVKAPTSSTMLFSGDKNNFSNLKSIEGTLDTSNVTVMASMFKDSQVLSLDVSNWNTSNVTNMYKMFFNSKIKTLDSGNWDTSKVTTMESMFRDSQITSLDVYNWDTSKAISSDPLYSMRNMLTNAPVSSLKVGLKFRFLSNVNLMPINTISGNFSGKWERIDPVSPISEYNNSEEFMKKYDGSQSGTYVWQRSIAKDLTVFYQD
ncbi:BspA family leucine-rich repeat surface protein, partial [Enterococcus faecalis]|uniref:BspA family leucine-rich repeat surface protein n=1 Tax=Enterococcus faecalis TaxID=1351 RepID=UPI000353D4B2